MIEATVSPPSVVLLANTQKKRSFTDHREVPKY